MKRRKSLGTTIMIAMTSLVVITLIIVNVVIVLRMRSVQNVIVDYNGKLSSGSHYRLFR